MTHPDRPTPDQPPILRQPTGPLGRFLRLLLAAFVVLSFISIADQGGPLSFRGVANLTEPSLLFLHVVMTALFLGLVGAVAMAVGRPTSAARWRIVGGLLLFVVVLLAAAVSQLSHGTIWDRPLSDVVWWFDALMLLETFVALLLSVVIGLPGCEIAVWPYLASRLRGQRTAPIWIACVVGLHLVDEWEAGRRQGAGGDRSVPS